MRARPLVKFRHNAAITIAALIALIGSVPFAAARWWLMPIVLIPIAIALWSWRVGVDVEDAGLRVRSVFASRRVPWTDIEGFTSGAGRVEAVLRSGHTLPLPAVRPEHLPRLIAAAGQPLAAEPDEPAGEPTDTAAAETPAGHSTVAPAEPPTGRDHRAESVGAPRDPGPHADH